MRVSTLLATVAGLVTATQAINILITNDDGFAAANVRELYRVMKSMGHNCWLVASANDQSGMGGRAVFTNSANLTVDTEFGVVKAGSPSLGTDPNDSHIWYYNGTPAAQVFVALDYVLPNFADFKVPDLVLAGPNFGLNLGPFLYTLSGTIGATYAAVERGIPAIAISAGYSVQTPFFQVNASTKAGLQDPATIAARLSANLAQAMIDKAKGGRILPLGYGLSVNIPFITSFVNDSCVNPPFILTRQTGGAVVDLAVYNSTTKLFTFGNLVGPGLNTCINGDCSLPGETDVINSGCKSSVSVFTVDYDAPTVGQCGNTTYPYSLVPPIVQLANSSHLVGALGANASVAGTVASNLSSTPTPSPTASSTPTTVAVSGAAGTLAQVGCSVATLALMFALLL